MYGGTDSVLFGDHGMTELGFNLQVYYYYYYYYYHVVICIGTYFHTIAYRHELAASGAFVDILLTRNQKYPHKGNVKPAELLHSAVFVMKRQ